jgi:geranylgeranyl diphosphate synthase type 3
MTKLTQKIVRGPYLYLHKIPGKDFRPQMIEAFNTVFKVPADKIQVISEVIEMLHTASLLIDDVEDSAVLRRGFPVAHSLFGTAQTINSSNYMMFHALRLLLALNVPEVMTIYTEEMLNLHRGQGLDLYWRDTSSCPTEDEYIEMVMHSEFFRDINS